MKFIKRIKETFKGKKIDIIGIVEYYLGESIKTEKDKGWTLMNLIIILVMI